MQDGLTGFSFGFAQPAHEFGEIIARFLEEFSAGGYRFSNNRVVRDRCLIFRFGVHRR